MSHTKVSSIAQFPRDSAKVREHDPAISRLKSDPTVQLGMEVARVRINVAKLAKDVRQKAGLTQVEVAELLDTTQKQISRIESCSVNAGDITVGMLTKYMKACGEELVVQLSDEGVKITSQKTKDRVVRLDAELGARA